MENAWCRGSEAGQFKESSGLWLVYQWDVDCLPSTGACLVHCLYNSRSVVMRRSWLTRRGVCGIITRVPIMRLPCIHLVQNFHSKGPGSGDWTL